MRRKTKNLLLTTAGKKAKRREVWSGCVWKRGSELLGVAAPHHPIATLNAYETRAATSGLSAEERHTATTQAERAKERAMAIAIQEAALLGTTKY